MIGWHIGVVFLLLSIGWFFVGKEELEWRDPVGFCLWLAAELLLLAAVAQGFLRPFEQVTLV